VGPRSLLQGSRYQVSSSPFISLFRVFLEFRQRRIEVCYYFYNIIFQNPFCVERYERRGCIRRSRLSSTRLRLTLTGLTPLRRTAIVSRTFMSPGNPFFLVHVLRQRLRPALIRRSVDVSLWEGTSLLSFLSLSYRLLVFLRRNPACNSSSRVESVLSICSPFPVEDPLPLTSSPVHHENLSPRGRAPSSVCRPRLVPASFHRDPDARGSSVVY